MCSQPWLHCSLLAALVGHTAAQDLFLSQDSPLAPNHEPQKSFRCATPDCEDWEENGFALSASELGMPPQCSWPRDQSVCPQKIGGDCPRNYENDMADYDPLSTQDLVVDDELLGFLRGKVEEYVQIVDDCVPPTGSADASVFSGAGGRALMHLRLHDRGFTPDGKPYTTHLARAREYIDVAVKQASTISRRYCGYPWGSAGVSAVAAIVTDLQGDAAAAATFVDQVLEAFRQAPDDDFCEFDDWDAGRSGLLYAAALLDHHFNRTVVGRDLVVAAANATVRRGARLGAAASVQHMLFSSPNDNGTWVDTSHGSAGVLYGLMRYAPEILEDPAARAIITRTVNYVVSTQQPSGNFPAEYFEPDEDVLVQWDHGAPGVSAMLFVAVQALPEEAAAGAWLASASSAMEVVWSRGLLTKGLMLCHGIGGNIYMQLFAAKMTGDRRYLHRALQFARFVAKTPELHDVGLMRIPTPSPFLFWIASWESTVMWASDLAANAMDPGRAAMPTWELTY